ncbi:MAG TPA: class I SAM-dependent methyltransferase [Thermoanaerobaculia bacterium]|nr:class I SAM-dependent methyltransferase [Thermoanaerobaculia bacterium]
MPCPELHLRARGEKSLRRRHPWIFSGAVASISGSPEPGDTVRVRSATGQALATAAWSPGSQIRARVWSFDPSRPVDALLLRERLERAIALRGERSDAESAACRLVFSESDRLPGLVVDRYGGHLVCQFLSAGAERWRGTVVDILVERLAPIGIWERSDVDVRRKEGLEPRTGLLWGQAPPERVEVVEDGLRLLVDLRSGHKTGLYLDQRENRSWLRGAAGGLEVLDAFSYNGGFALAALAGGAARVVQVEASAPALELGRAQAACNGFAESRLEQLQGDAFELLRELRAQGRAFDLVVLDPPKFVHRRAQLNAAARGYKDVNRLGFELLRPGGALVTFSCSGLLDPALFQKIVADAALDARVDAQLVARLGQAPDHPTLLSFPEASYLKGLVCRVGT